MAGDRMRIALSIRNEVEGDLEGPYPIWLGQGELLCPVLEGYRAVANWYSVRSVNIHTSPHLNWTVAGQTDEATRPTVNSWGTSLWDIPENKEHRLTLTTNWATTNAWRDKMQTAGGRLPFTRMRGLLPRV